MYALQPQKKSNGCLKGFAVTGVIAIACLALLVLAFFASALSPSSANSSRSTHHVVYKVTTNRNWGSCYGFDTTYEMPSGTAQKSVSTCDGATTTDVDQRSGSRGDFVYLSVQNDKQAARISCQIYIDGKVVFQTWSNGQYVIATCSGSIP